MTKPLRTVHTADPARLPKHFDAPVAEARCQQKWERLRISDWDATRSPEENFVVDTPPPTVSGSLHVGHVFSYTHTDVIVRYQRMRGRNIFYPMGWDDNGLPTERRVQNYFHVRCDPRAPYEPGLTMEAPSSARRREPPRIVSRPNFIDLCEQVTREDEEVFKTLWKRLGLSVDWRQEYATINRHCRHLAQLSFHDLYKKGHIYSVEAPTMWDVDFQTAVAQAEVEDRTVKGAFHHITFGVVGGGEGFVIATTRPELLAACVGVTAHPGDERYAHLFGRHALTPLFRVPVPIFPSELVDPEKGTGILMVCTFGDATDVEWWREQKLPLRQVLGRDGRFVPIPFGDEGWESHDPESAARYYDALGGKTVAAARAAMVELLRDPAGSVSGSEPPLRGVPRPVEHSIKFYEKGDRPLEFVSTRQWFVRLLDKKEQLLAKGDAIRWHPDFMRLRCRNWTENLNVDWCISRQRYFGVPFPVWYPLDSDGKPNYTRAIVAEPAAMPVDPMTDSATGYTESQRDAPGGFTGESDVFDTWFTSSLTPQVSSRWLTDTDRHRRLFPADIRPQSHEIIRTWAFYTIVKALLHEDTVPWRHVVVSGWILDPDRKKMSKSRGNVTTPLHLLDQYGADGVRYWAAGARLGTDTIFDEKVLKVGKRLVTKLFNAGKFVLSQTGPVESIEAELDRAFVQRLHGLTRRVTASFEEFDFAHALQETESFFWNDFTDTFIELVKVRAREEGAGSAIASLRLGLSVLLRLFAPALPFITEEIWSWTFAQETGFQSIHRAPWPGGNDFAGIGPPVEPGSFDVAVACLGAINKEKSESGVSVGRRIDQITVAASPETLARFRSVCSDVMAAARVEAYEMQSKPDLSDGVFEVAGVKFADAPEA